MHTGREGEGGEGDYVEPSQANFEKLVNKNPIKIRCTSLKISPKKYWSFEKSMSSTPLVFQPCASGIEWECNKHCVGNSVREFGRYLSVIRQECVECLLAKLMKAWLFNEDPHLLIITLCRVICFA